jgi:integrase
MGQLTALSVKSAKAGRHADGDGLYLLVKPTGGKSWLLRIQVEGKRRDIGLGTLDQSPRAAGRGEASPIDIPLLQRKILTLSEARDKARILRDAAKAGLDPIAERDRERRGIPTFREAAISAHAALKEGWSEKGAANFLTSLETHAYSGLGKKRVDAITAGDITAVLAPIWTTKPDMGRKVRQRTSAVLNYAHGQGWRTTEAPGKSVTVSLPRQPKGGNYDAMPYADVPAFVAKLKAEKPTSGRLALLFQILTAARPGEVRAARWGQIDEAKAEWNRPAEMMKMDVPHTVTLSSAALAILKQARDGRTPNPDALIFPGRGGGMFSDMTLNKVLRTANQPYDAHGFRSSFRDWAADETEVSEDVAEAAIAHKEPNKTKRAYKRTGHLERRRPLLEAWGQFVAPVATPQ